MNREEIIALLGEDWKRFEDFVRESLQSDIPMLNSVNDTLLSNAGKRLRPMLLLLVAKALGGINRESLCFAAATEMIHNATLFHDDVVDESPTRRGKPSLSSIVGPSAAVLIGDFWLSRAVDLIVGTRHQSEAIQQFSGVLSRLAEGEMLQMQKVLDNDTSEDDYFRIINCKTASLFEAACRLGAYSVDAAPGLVEAAGRYGAALGSAFQIRDDIFDYQQGEIGKPVGIDLKEQKITLPLLGAMLHAPGQEEAIRAKVRDIPEHPEYCDGIHSFVLENGGIEYASARLDSFIEEAISALDAFPASAPKDMLVELARYNAFRNR